MPVKIELSLVRERFSAAAARLYRVLIEQRDFADCIRRWDSPSTFFYCDPPYVGTSGQAAVYNSLTAARHTELRDLLSRVRGKWLLSYNDVPFIRQLYRGFKLRAVGVRVTLPRGDTSGLARRRELLIRNF